MTTAEKHLATINRLLDTAVQNDVLTDSEADETFTFFALLVERES